MGREAADIARRAAEIIQERGICKGQYNSWDGRVCLWGALAAAVGGESFFDIPFALQGTFTDALGEMFPEDRAAFSVIPGAKFNDAPDTDERDVAKVLLQVADRLEIGGES